jgi:hypothetical protein
MKLAKPLLLLSVGLAISPSLLAQGSPGNIRQALLTTNAARFTAKVRGDLAGLDTLLAPDLTYIHSDGALESKAQFLATLRTGRLRYEAISPYDLEERIYGEAGVVTGRSAMRVRVGQDLLRFSIRFTAMYRREGRRWVLVAWQATRLTEQ